VVQAAPPKVHVTADLKEQDGVVIVKVATRALPAAPDDGDTDADPLAGATA
jgi:hypothetical protein